MGRMGEKVAIVTGGASGIGRACALRFAAEGARVVIAGRREATGHDTARRIGRAAFFHKTDVLREDDIKALVEATLERFGRIDCVVSNAGTTSGTLGITDTQAGDFDRDIALHVRAAFLAMKHASPPMIRQGRGSFINMASLSAHRAGYNTFGYEVAKAALVHLTRCAALELGEHGVRVNSISPGPTLTGIFTKHGGADADAADGQIAAVETAMRKILPAIQPVPGMAHPDDIASAALFLASDEARFVNGHDLIVDGGIAAGRPASAMRATWDVLAKEIATALQ